MPDSSTVTVHAKPTKHPWSIPVLFLYLLVSLILAARMVTITWPGNATVALAYAPEYERRGWIAEAYQTLQTLEDASATLNRLPLKPDGAPPSQAALSELNRTLAWLQGESSRTDPGFRAALAKLSSDSSLWSAQQVKDLANGVLVVRRKIADEYSLQTVPRDAPGFWTILCPFWSPTARTQPADVPDAAMNVAAIDQSVARALSAEPPHLFGSAEVELLLLFFALGAFGACIPALSSLVAYAGLKEFRSSWSLYYVARPFIGGGIGPLFYLLSRGGLFIPSTNSDDLNLFGFSAIAVLTGWFSSEAMEKLKAIAQTMLSGKEQRDSIAKSGLKLLSATATQESTVLDANHRRPFLITLHGSGFSPRSFALINGIGTQPTSRRQGEFTVAATLSPDTTSVALQVINPGGGADDPTAATALSDILVLSLPVTPTVGGVTG